MTACETNRTKEKTNIQCINDNITRYFHNYYNDNKNYTHTNSDFFGFSSQGGTVEGYFKDEKLKRMTMLLYGEMGKSEYNCYIIDDNNAYIIITNYEYDKPFDEKPEIKNQYMEEYYIINNEVMIYSNQKQNVVKSSDNNILTLYNNAKAQLKK